jgi:predicted small lipoprotein YifL
MDRRLVITICFLILVLAALAMAGMLGPAGAPAASTVSPPSQAAPGDMPERTQALSALPNGGAVALVLAPAGMSGEFDKRLLADVGTSAVPVDKPMGA